MYQRNCGMEYPEATERPKMEMNKEWTEQGMLPGVVCPPIYECPQERVCHRQIVHEVPQE